MQLLSIVVLLVAANICSANTITMVKSDWSTFRVDLVTNSDYDILGRGPAGDIFHMYFDFNRAYLPYLNGTGIVSDMDNFPGGMQNMLTADPTDWVEYR